MYLGSTDRMEIGHLFSRVVEEAFEETNLCGRLLLAGNSRFLFYDVLFSVITLFLYLLVGNEPRKGKTCTSNKRIGVWLGQEENKKNPSEAHH